MIHFIPAWYGSERPWYSTDSSWFVSRASAEADDTVTQVRIFHQGADETRLVVLNYVPSLRRFLHSQSIFDVPYWSFFDAVQGLENDYARPIDFLTLEWPADVSFHYNPFIVTVMQGDEVYARVFLAREGTLQSIRFYGDGMPALERIYDDRGFLSSVLMHDESGRPMTQYYLSRDGDVIVSEDVQSRRIDVVQNDDERFRQSSYASWEELIAEFLDVQFGARDGQHDTVVLAVAEQHNDLVAAALTDQTLVLSRSVNRAAAASQRVLERAGAVFADVGEQTSGDAEQLFAWELLPVLSIYPLERRATFGASANEAKIYITLFVDDITPDQLDYAIAMAAGQLVGNEQTRLLVCTFRSQDVDFLTEIRRVIGGYQHLDQALFAADEIAALGIDVGITEAPEERIQLVFVDREAELIQTITKSRVLVDLGVPVNYKLATEAVNAGVPQINRLEHELATHPINGYVVSDESELGTALDFFLNGLEHWNQSLVQCRVLQDLFRAQEVLGRWDLIREAVAYASPADRA